MKETVGLVKEVTQWMLVMMGVEVGDLHHRLFTLHAGKFTPSFTDCDVEKDLGHAMATVHSVCDANTVCVTFPCSTTEDTNYIFLCVSSHFDRLIGRGCCREQIPVL